MSDKTSIEWTDATWNPVRGCARVSPGCQNCYAEREAGRFAGPGRPFDGFVQIGQNGRPGVHWTGKVELIADRLNDPLRWPKSRRIFVNSMSDLFHEDLAIHKQESVFRVMLSASQHQYQILTKRADVMAQRVPIIMNRIYGPHWRPPSFIRLGVSSENQQYFDERIEDLTRLIAGGWNTMVSCEPLLGPLDVWNYLDSAGKTGWVIAGGESGPGARPIHPEWVRSIRDQCVAAGVPFFFKQWGAYQPIGCADMDSTDWDGEAVDGASIERTIRVYRDGRADNGDEYSETRGAWFMEPVGKKAAGALLDGREWRQFPEVRNA